MGKKSKVKTPLMTKESVEKFTEMAKSNLSACLKEIESYPEQENEYVVRMKKRLNEELVDLDNICAKMIRVINTYQVYTIEEIKEILKKDPMI